MAIAKAVKPNSPQLWYNLSTVQDLGFGWIRQQVRWEHVERSDGSYGWGDADRVADAASRAGIQAMSGIVTPPDRVWSDGTGVAPPDDPQDLADFMKDMAARYRGRVRAYEVWKEQNSRG